MNLIYISIVIIILSIYLFYIIVSLFYHLNIQSKPDSCFQLNQSNMSGYKLYNNLNVNTIVYDERIPGYKIFGTGKIIESINFECLLFRLYNESECTAYIQKINKQIEDGFVITVIIKEIDFTPKFIMLNEYCFSLPDTISITKPLYNYTLCVIPEIIEKDKLYQRKWINYNRRIGIDKIIVYKHFNSNVINTYKSDLLDIITMDKKYSTDLIVNDCFYRYRRLTKSFLYMRMNDVILFLKTSSNLKLNNVIKQKDIESNDIIYLCKCKAFDKLKNLSFSIFSKHNTKYEIEKTCSYIILNNFEKYNYITQKVY